MATYKSIVAYDGTQFEGFQRQAAGRRTVQAELERALAKLGWREASLKAAGRTDAGVHARGQVIAYQLEWRHPPTALTRALNAALPADVAVRATQEVAPDFHPRFAARGRRYRYQILLDAVRDPLQERYAWRIWPAPELEAMQLAGEMLLGEHDFGAFGSAPIAGGHTRRQVRRAAWKREGPRLAFEIEADAFLYHMVRRLVGAMVEIGWGRKRLQRLSQALARPQNPWQGLMAPPQGLCLEEVIYPPISGDRRP